MTEIPLLFRGVSAASAFALGITLKVHSSATAEEWDDDLEFLYEAIFLEEFRLVVDGSA